jgi:hypothetical protein
MVHETPVFRAKLEPVHILVLDRVARKHDASVDVRPVRGDLDWDRHSVDLVRFAEPPSLRKMRRWRCSRGFPFGSPGFGPPSEQFDLPIV